MYIGGDTYVGDVHYNNNMYVGDVHYNMICT